MISYEGLLKLGFSKGDFELQDDSDGNGVYIAEWLSDQPQPSEADITTAHAEWEAEYDATQYQRDRQPNYPSLADFADAYYWEKKGDSTLMDAYVAKCDKVKLDYPKE